MRINDNFHIHAGRNKHGKKYFKICLYSWRFVVANCSVQIKGSRNEMTKGQRRRFREQLLEENENKCECCGKQLTHLDAQLHHILPICMAPELAADKSNLMLLCPTCHKAIHSNPFVYSRQILDRYPEVAAQFSLQ